MADKPLLDRIRDVGLKKELVEIVGILRQSDRQASLYAAVRIEELEAEIEQLRAELYDFEAGAKAEADLGDEARAEVKRLRDAVATVRGWYPADLFPDDVEAADTEGKRRARAAAKMARLTCDNILMVAREAAEAKEK